MSTTAEKTELLKNGIPVEFVYSAKKYNGKTIKQVLNENGFKYVSYSNESKDNNILIVKFPVKDKEKIESKTSEILSLLADFGVQTIE